ncbi:hypothetical protein LX16_2429 [Stackebrandtia albiflava]|uniref:Uncharacterized protein n=1 Tax=Stackebrandtia albiflava TaxID=406432 RepID=A0A562V1L7_9ACTN|nr:hypothetical protein [Stackebrandtia albiflava]TWJ11702.1 hypothetical protein LX16_2429 [Stackebrandtia albiflava]
MTRPPSPPYPPGGRAPQRVAVAEPAESYPDPPRSWRRAGLLFAAWAAAWTAVLILGLGWQVVAAPSGTGNPVEDDPVNPRDVTRKFFAAIFTEQDLSLAARLQCPDPPGLDPQEIWSAWQTDIGDYGGQVGFDNDNAAADWTTSFVVQVTVTDGGVTQGRAWVVETVGDGGDALVCDVTALTP